MKKLKLTFLLLSLLAICVPVFAKSLKPGRVVVSLQNDKPKRAVELLIEDLQKHNESVLRRCLENCGDTQEHANEPSEKKERILNKVVPAYPPIARAAHATGEVVVTVVVNEEGNVIAAQAESGHPLLQAAAVNAARESTFVPYLVDGKPVKVLGTITYNFTLAP